MATTLGCNTTRVLCNAPVAGTRNTGEPSTSSISRLHLRGRLSNKKPSLKLTGRRGLNDGICPLVRASLSNEGDDVRELASEKAVESGGQVVQDSKKLANGQSFVVLDAKTEDASDAASYEGDVREGVVDVASDTAVDTTDDVDTLATKDAAPLADTYGRSVEDTAEALEAKAVEVGDREVTKESGESQGSSGPFFKDQVVKEDMLNRSGSFRKIGDQFEGLKRTFSKNLKEGIDSNRPGLEELSRNASKSVKAGREYLDDAGVGAADISGDAQTVLEDAKGALDKRQSAVSLAVEDARETGSMVAELATKGWDALSKTTEKFLAKFQKNFGELQVTAQEKAEEAKQRAGVTADQAQKQFAEAKLKAEEAADQAQIQFAEAKSNLQANSDALRDAAQDIATESRSNLEKAVEEAQRRYNEARDNVQAKTAELEDTAQEKASESESNLEDTAEAAQSKAGELSSAVEEKVGDVKGNVESKAEDVSERSESSVIDPTQGAQGAVQYSDSGIVNDEWKGKAQ